MELSDKKACSSGTSWNLLEFLALGCFLAYSAFFWLSLRGRWFSSAWTSDDALQQTFPFHSVYHPEIFQNDLITTAMEGYLAPFHYWLSYFITWLTADPVMTAHWVMAVQLIVTLIFFFLLVRHCCGSRVPAFFALIWFLHSRTIVQRLTAGLPRGWAAVIFSAFLYFLATKNHRAIRLLIFFGCLSNPPATFLCCAAYGLLLLYELYRPEDPKLRWRNTLALLCWVPLYLFSLYIVVQRPPEIGPMVTTEEAYEMEAFQKPAGRFAFLPLPSVVDELQHYGMDVFKNRLYEPGMFWQAVTPWLIILTLIGFLLLGRKKLLIPKELWIFLLAIAVVYLASRQVVFKLYVPDRHLLLPLGFFFISAFSIGLWRLGQSAASINFRGVFALLLLAVLLSQTSGSGLYGDANFNYHIYKKGKAFLWLKNHSPEQSLIAGHPTHIDPLLLFGMRKAYITSETAHPFYPVYFKEVSRRIEISLKAHYARTLQEFVEILLPEQIDYFVFSRQRFYATNLQTEKIYEPFYGLLKQLTSRDYRDYAYKRLPAVVDLEKYPFLVFRDNDSAVVNVSLLRQYLREHPEFDKEVL